jgi:peptide/nickel transport system ATP-binding protein
MMVPLLQVENLHVTFPAPKGNVLAVSGVDFSIKKGQIFGIVGESGCGKTATGRAILKLVPPPGIIANGRILLHGDNLVEKSEQEMRLLRGKRIGMVFQDPAAALNPLFTIGQQLLGIMKRHKIAEEKESLNKAAIELLGDLGLPNPEEILDSYPHQLSGGMQQRSMIAMALSTKPDLLIADEPTSALDVTIQSQILDLLVQLKEDRGVTIILITHDLGVVAETCEQVAVFYSGKIVETGTVHEIFQSTKHPYTQGLLAALPNPKSIGGKLNVIPGNVPTNLEKPVGCAFAPRCESVMPICTEIDPPAIQFSESHMATCHLYADKTKSGNGGGT